MEISETSLTVVEGDPAQGGRVLCTADALPEAEFHWVKVGEEDDDEDDDDVHFEGNVLFFADGARRDQAGRYECVAFNKHGREARSVDVDVQCED